MTLPTEAAPAQPTPVATPLAAPTVETTAVVAAEAHTEAVAIAELCLLAGCPERTTEFLAARLSAAQVRQVLLQARADQVEIASHHAPVNTTGAMTVANATNPVLDAVRKRIASTPLQGA